jgi:hypothetical protein
MIDYVDLARRLRGRGVKDDALMPRAYQFANPTGRPFHDDWRIPWLPAALQPWGRIRRMDTTFLLPMPMKLLQAWGPVAPRWMPWQQGYVGGMAPIPEAFRLAEAGTEAAARGCAYEMLAYDPVLPAGQAALYAVWLDDAWRPCFYTRTDSVAGRRIHHNRGLKPDVTLGDFMWNFPEASLSVGKAA